ncbi:MAG: sulfotransferase domain-containing protein [Bacteroidota bacterium]
MNLAHRLGNRMYYELFIPRLERINAQKNSIHPQNPLLIFGNPRGGTTWMGEILETLPNSILAHEPLRRGRLKELIELDFFWHQPIPIEDDWQEAQEIMRKLLNREILDISLYFQNKIWTLPQKDCFIFKFCHGNMLLAWLVKKFPVNPVLIARHPCAVVASQLNHGGWKDLKSGKVAYDIPEFRNNEVYLQYIDILSRVKSIEENLAATWALTMTQTISHPLNNIDWITVSYESLYLKFEWEIQRIFSRLGIPVPQKVWELKRRPSKSTSPQAKAYISSGRQLQKWKDYLSKTQQDRILSIVKEFGIGFYNKSLEPDYDQIYRGDKT